MAERRAEGRAEGRLNVLNELVKMGKLSLDEAARMAQMSVEELEKAFASQENK